MCSVAGPLPGTPRFADARLNYYIKGDNLKLMGGFEYSQLENTPRGDLLGYTLIGAVRMLF
jgi:hypothetical protein